MEPETKPRKRGRRPGTKYPGVGGNPGGKSNPNAGRRRTRIEVNVKPEEYPLLQAFAAQKGQTLEDYCAVVLSRHTADMLIV